MFQEWLRLHPDYPEEQAIYLDVGGNIGSCVMEMLHSTRAKIVVVEPHPLNLQKMTSTLVAQPMELRKRVALFPMAAGNESNHAINIYMSSNNRGNSIVGKEIRVDSSEAFQPAVPISVEALDNLFHSTTNYTIALMKLDVQGYECLALDGMTNHLLSRVQMIKTEADPTFLQQQGCTLGGLMDRLREANFSVTQRGSEMVARRDKPPLKAVAWERQIQTAAQSPKQQQQGVQNQAHRAINGLSSSANSSPRDSEDAKKERGIWVRQEYLDHLKTLGPIPRKVHVFWPKKTLLEHMELNMVKYGIGQLAQINPTWNVTVYDDADIGALIQQSTDLLPTEELKVLKTAHIVEQSDVARLIVLYRQGGLYVDLDTLMNKPLDPILRNDTLGKYMPALTLSTFRDINFAQSLLCSSPGNNLWKWHLERSTQVRLRGGYNENKRAKPLERLPNGWLQRTDLFKIGPPVYNEVLFSRVLDGPLAQKETSRAHNIPHPPKDTMAKAREAIEFGLGPENSGLILTTVEMGCTGLLVSYPNHCPPLQKHVAQRFFGIKQWGPEVQAHWDAAKKKEQEG